MNKPTNINNAPNNATHWAPETDQWIESYYRLEKGLWYCVNDYWASDVDERPYGRAAKKWSLDGVPLLQRPFNDLTPLSELKNETF